jgi:ABC-type nitrate/sulfonate/bicarbonate transport system permease component
MRLAKIWALRALLVAVLIGAWAYATGPGEASPLILPPITDVADQFVSDLGERQTYSDMAVTLWEILTGFVAAVVAGMAVGFWCARRPVRRLVFERLLSWGYLTPLLLFYPLFILWFGVGPTSKMAFAALAAFFPVAYNTLRGFQSVDRRYLVVATAYRASAMQTDLLVKYQAALPLITSGVRIAAATTTTTVVLTEMIASHAGLGYQLTQASTTFVAARTFAIVLVLMILVAFIQIVVHYTMRPRWTESPDAL